jgi:MFS family permease
LTPRLGWFSSANDIGATGGPLIGGFVLYLTASYSLTYLLVGTLGVLTLLVVLLLPDVDRPVREAKTFAARAAEFRQGIAEVFRTPPIFVAAGIEAIMYLGYGAFLGFLPIYAKSVRTQRRRDRDCSRRAAGPRYGVETDLRTSV